MSHHCCGEGCDCRRKDITLDTDAVKTLARERGVAMPVSVKYEPRQRPWWAFWRRDRYDDTEGRATHWSLSPLSPVRHHEILVIHGTAAGVIRVVLHEIEHCIQCESFPTNKAWGRAYARTPKEWEHAAIQAEDEWENYGYLINPKEST